MRMFQILLVIMTLGILGYTGVTIAEHGPNLVPVFFGDMMAMGWPGQFNFDFMMFLWLSALWTGWRDQFRGKGLLLMPVALFGGIMFLAPYLLILSIATSGDVRIMLLGQGRAT